MEQLTSNGLVTRQEILEYKQNRDEKLGTKIVNAYRKLVSTMAKRYAAPPYITKEELESYGYEGLLIALEKYGVDCNLDFSFYANIYIEAKILRGIQDIMKGQNADFFYNFLNAKKTVEKESGMTLLENWDLVEDIINLLVREGKLGNNSSARDQAREWIKALVMSNVSLNGDLQKVIASGELIDPCDYAERVLNETNGGTFEDIFNDLDEIEVVVLKLRYGIEDGVNKTLDEVAKIMNLTLGGVRNIEQKAISKIRKSILDNGIGGYLNRQDGAFKR